MSEFELVFTPQCLTCKYNKDKINCEKFKPKPEEYSSNTTICPEHENLMI